MTAIKIPTILNRLAEAGSTGIRHDSLETGQREEIDLCRNWDLPIESGPDIVRLISDDDTLVPLLIEKETPVWAWDKTRVAGFFSVGSTNDDAAVRARQGAPPGTVVVAAQQLSGRGRKGRAWISPAHAGLYFTLILRPRQDRVCWPILTHVAAVALVGSLRHLCRTGFADPDLRLDIKWPNDILLSGRKTAGILLETAGTGDADPAALIGVGVNIGANSVPADLLETATALNLESSIPVPRRRLLVSFLSHFQEKYIDFEEGRHADILDEWKRSSSMWDGVPIQVAEEDRNYPATTCGLTELGALRVRTDDGREKTLLAADVSIRRF